MKKVIAVFVSIMIVISCVACEKHEEGEKSFFDSNEEVAAYLFNSEGIDESRIGDLSIEYNSEEKTYIVKFNMNDDVSTKAFRYTIDSADGEIMEKNEQTTQPK